MEWIFEYKTMENNPFYTDDGIKEIKKVSDLYTVRIGSLLADYFMEKKLFGKDSSEIKKSVEMLFFIIDQCKKCNIPVIEIPLVDSSAIRTMDDKKQLINNLKKPLKYASEKGIDISLETSLPPKEFRELILDFKPYDVKVNYDMGNSASLGFDPLEEINLLGEFIVNVHIKDRVKGGGTVPLGFGNTDFSSVFTALKKINYSEDLILQAARQDLNEHKIKKDIIKTIKGYIVFIEPYVKEI
jgi:hexulose-6-phosphate isomerase